MNNKIEVKKIEKGYMSCNCCRNKDLDMYEISFMYNMGIFGSQGITIVICENCITDLKDKLSKIDLEKEV